VQWKAIGGSKVQLWYRCGTVLPTPGGRRAMLRGACPSLKKACSPVGGGHEVHPVLHFSDS